MDNCTDVIIDIEKTNEYINKLSKYIDKAEDKKIEISNTMSETTNLMDKEMLKREISEYDKIIRSIKNDISYVKTSSMMYVFYKKARKMIPKHLLKEIETEVNNQMLINMISVGDELTCIVTCDGVSEGDKCECSNIDKFNDLISINGKNEYYNIRNFKPLINKIS